ncbi:hypothetical protein [Rhizobium sp. MHM7A]|uniref:hypothetical protein n=1 Tax=Rhizobium sp. MHM7A TaxID=2583233 RepID=UPI001105B3E5|nr:hypothetical protein [Rhizobium sp. MHM7A]TLX15781.1 hypothetical protein FFR93_00245 [Rhizobium sp. MHM7A]
MRAFVFVMAITSATAAYAADYKINVPMSDADAKGLMRRAELWVKNKCTGKKRPDWRCDDYAATVIYTSIQLQDYVKAANYATVYPFSDALDQYNHCGTYIGEGGRPRHTYILNGPLTYYLLNKERGLEDTGNFWHAFLCEAFHPYATVLKAVPPNPKLPSKLSEYLDIARSDFPARESNELARFYEEIVTPYKETEDAITLKDSARYAAVLDLTRNAAQAAKQLRFGKRYVTFLENSTEYWRRMLTISEQNPR